MECIQCGEESKYKCPVCHQPYCSVTCCKQHKQVPCIPPSPIEEKASINELHISYEFSTDDTVPPEKLKLLEHSTEVRKCLENPHVREILKLLDTSLEPDMLIKEYMQEPIFTEFVDACLNVVQEKYND